MDQLCSDHSDKKEGLNKTHYELERGTVYALAMVKFNLTNN